MKKILNLFVGLTLLIALVGCFKVPETFAKFSVKYLDSGTSLEITIKIEDPDDEVKGDIYLTLTEVETDKVVSEYTTTKAKIEEEDEEENDNTITISGLTLGTKYILEIRTTINEKILSMYKQTLTTKPPLEIPIKTVEEFLDIKNNRNAHYTLENDLDFAGYEEEINKNAITLFSGTFNGNNKTIKNFTSESTSINMGIFNQLSTNAKIFDLTLDNITIKTKNKASGSKRAGILFGQNTSRSTEIRNITIINSTLDIELNGTSEYQEIGFLGGAAVANISNIYIDNTNTMNIKQERVGKTRIGGLVGKMDNTSAEDVVVKNIVLAGVINYHLEQTTENGLEKKEANINIGGVAGRGGSINLQDAVVETLINVLAGNIYVLEPKEEQKEQTVLYFLVAGIFANSTNIKLKNILYHGNINVEEFKVHDKLPEDRVPRFIIVLDVGGIYTTTQAENSSLDNVLRAGGTFNIFESADVRLRVGTLFVYASKINYRPNNKFGITSDVSNDNPSIVIFEVIDMFNEDSFVYKNFIK